MLTTLLVLATTAFAAQDAPVDVLPPPPPPSGAAGVAVEAGAASAETSPEVRAFLTDAEQLLYDPQAAGLKSVEFDATVEIPNLGPVGNVHVSWAEGADTIVAFEKDATAQLPPGIPPELLTMSGEQFGRDFLDQMLNRPISPLLVDSLVKMEPPQDGLVCISVAREAERLQKVKEHNLLFDGDGLLQKTKLLMDTTGMGMPFNSMPITEVYTWKPSAPGSELMILDSRAGEQDYGMIGTAKTNTVFSYTAVDNLLLLTGMAVDTQPPPMLGGAEQRQVALRNLVVNGKPAAIAPMAVPAVAPAGTAVPVAPAGG